MYDPLIDGRKLTFGVSGKLYKSALVLYDRQTGSLWSQILQEAIAGPLTGATLRMLSVEHTTWGRWRQEHPGSLVLSPDTGFNRDYGLDPYESYREKGVPKFRRDGTRPVTEEASKLRPMERVLGVQIDGVHKAYPFSLLQKTQGSLQDQVGGKAITIHFDRASETAYATDAKGVIVPSMTVFWFAWLDFYPNTLVASSH